ncbi:the ARF-like 2 binding protein BART domain-containing protein [Ditylenchus destructor]|nr:the ARF-like 2 binding protein BART domain-containing protein [Ditylenchus destructor]
MLRRSNSKSKRSANLQQIFQQFLKFLETDMWSLPTTNFMEQNSIAFEREQGDPQTFTAVYNQFRDLVDTLMDSYCEDTDINPQDLVEALKLTENSAKLNYKEKVLLECVVAAQDFNVFVPMMMRKNIELQLQALKMLEHLSGLLPNSLTLEEDDAEIWKVLFDEDESEKLILISVLKQSREEWERDQRMREEWQRQVDAATQNSLREKEILEEMRRMEQLRMEDAMRMSEDRFTNMCIGSKNAEVNTVEIGTNSVGTSTQSRLKSASTTMPNDVGTSTDSRLKSAATNTQSRQKSAATSTPNDVGTSTDLWLKSASTSTPNNVSTGTDSVFGKDESIGTEAEVAPESIQTSLQINEDPKPKSAAAWAKNGSKKNAGVDACVEKKSTGTAADMNQSSRVGARLSKVDAGVDATKSKNTNGANTDKVDVTSRGTSAKPPATPNKHAEKPKTPSTKRTTVPAGNSYSRSSTAAVNNGDKTSLYPKIVGTSNATKDSGTVQPTAPPEELKDNKDSKKDRRSSLGKLKFHTPTLPGEGEESHAYDYRALLKSRHGISEEQIQQRAQYLKQQRDKLLELKRKERAKQLQQSFDNGNLERPRTAKAARASLLDDDELNSRRNVAEKIKTEIARDK